MSFKGQLYHLIKHQLFVTYYLFQDPIKIPDPKH